LRWPEVGRLAAEQLGSRPRRWQPFVLIDLIYSLQLILKTDSIGMAGIDKIIFCCKQTIRSIIFSKIFSILLKLSCAFGREMLHTSIIC